MRDTAVKMGAQVSPQTLNAIADNVLQFGWNDSQIQDTLSGAIKMGANNTFGGQAAVNAQDLRTVALNNGVSLGDQTLTKWVQRIGAGEDISGFEAYVRNMAKSSFPGYETELDAGMNMRDIADPYVQQMAKTLEMDPTQIDLFDPTIRKALQATDPTTGKVTSQPLYEFEKQLRQDPRWLQTNNARDTLMSTTHNLLQQWGVVS